jgi:hypothetical protein
MLDRLVKISSLSGAFLIFCGVLKMIIYYDYFNVNIVDFLSFSEIITSFLDDMNILLIYVAIMLIVTVSTVNFLHRRTEIPVDDLMTGIMNVIFPHKYKFVVFFLIIILILSSLIFFNIIGFNYFAIYVLVFCSIQMLTYVIMTRDENNEIEIPTFSVTVSIALVVTLAIFLLARHDVQEVKKHAHPVTIVTQENTYICNRNTANLYLGKTDNFVFIKLDSSNSTLSLPTSSIKSLDFK